MPKERLDFETKLDKSKEILERLMNPEITLKESILAYEQGMMELNEAQKMLEDAEIKIQEIKAAK